jgi:hypothetical protein
MKTALVLKPFPYAHDGMHVRDMAKGETFECHDDVFDGLAKDGYIKATKSKADVAAEGEAEAQAEADAKGAQK